MLSLEWPAAGLSLWLAFCGMARTQTMSGPGPLSMTEIEAFQRLYGMRFNHWELDMLKTFDAVVLETAT